MGSEPPRRGRGLVPHHLRQRSGHRRSRSRAREAIFLVAGDKAGQGNAWYRTAIPLADERYEQHLADLKEQEAQ